MRSILRIAIVCIVIGCIFNVLIAWACAIWSSPPGVTATGISGVDPLLMARLRREFFNRPGPDPGGNDPGTLFVTVAYECFGAQFMDIAVEDKDIPTDAFKGPLPYIGVTRAGWPWLALEGQWHRDASRSPNPGPATSRWAVIIPALYVRADRLFLPRMLLFRPMWPGFVINTLVFAAAVAMPFLLRAVVRKLRGRCIACGYPIGESPVCTECGSRVRAHQRHPFDAKLSA